MKIPTIILICVMLSAFGYWTALERTLRLDESVSIRADLAEAIRERDRLDVQLERDEYLISLILPGWDRSAPVLSKEVTVTAYTSRPEETDSTPYITACNTPVQVGGIAVSRDLFEELGGCGASLTLSGYGALFVNDKMNARFKDTVDIWSGDLEAAELHGPKTATMVWQ